MVFGWFVVSVESMRSPTVLMTDLTSCIIAESFWVIIRQSMSREIRAEKLGVACELQLKFYFLLTPPNFCIIKTTKVLESLSELAKVAVRILFHLWAVWRTRVMRRESHFGIGIVQGMIPSGFPVFWVAVPGCSRKGYGTSPNLWVEKKLVKFWQSTQDTRLCPTEFFWEFFSFSPFDLFRNLGDVFLSHFWTKCVLWLIIPGILRCFSRNCC